MPNITLQKKKTKKAASKARTNTYVSAMRNQGLPGSYADQRFGGAGTAVYNAAKASKGKKYADMVYRKAGGTRMVDL